MLNMPGRRVAYNVVPTSGTWAVDISTLAISHTEKCEAGHHLHHLQARNAAEHPQEGEQGLLGVDCRI